jgi:transposase
VSKISTVGVDLAKSVFQIHGADERGAVALRKKLRRAQVVSFFSGLAPCVVAMEACASAHYWAREIAAVGHEVRLIPPAYVKPFVKRQKNDAADAEAICEAAQRPTMRFVGAVSQMITFLRFSRGNAGQGSISCDQFRSSGIVFRPTSFGTAFGFIFASR